MVAIQHSSCRLDVVDILRQALPRHGQQVVNIGADNSSLLGHALSPFQPLQLLLHGLDDLLREMPLAQPFLVFLNIPQNAVLVTQLIVDGLDLLPEIIFLLHLLNLAAHPGANLALNIQDILFPLQEAVQLFKPFLHIDALKNSLPVVQLQIDMAGNHICQPPGIIYNRNRYHGICRNFLAALDPLLKLVHNHTNQGLHLYGLVNLVMVLPDIGNQVVILLLNGTDNLAAVKALYQHPDCPVRQLHQVLYLSHRAHAVQIRHLRVLQIRIPLRHQENVLILPQHGLFQGRNRLLPAGIQMNHHIWKDHHAPKRQHRQHYYILIHFLHKIHLRKKIYINIGVTLRQRLYILLNLSS